MSMLFFQIEDKAETEMKTVWVSRMDYAFGKRGIGIINAIHNVGHPWCSRGCDMAAFYFEFNLEDVEKDNMKAQPLDWICTRHNPSLRNPKDVTSIGMMLDEMEKSMPE